MDTATDTSAAPAAEAPAEQWARVEIMGHRTHWGRVSEVEQFGAKMLRVDVPQGSEPDAPFVSHEYAGSALFGILWCDEATARARNAVAPRPACYLTDQSGDGEDF